MIEVEIQNALYRMTPHRLWSNQKMITPNRQMWGTWESDLAVVLHSHYWHEIEIKVSVADFRAEFRTKDRKHRYLLNPETKGCHEAPNYFWFAMPQDMVPVEEVPAYAGLIYIALDGEG